MSGVIGQMAMAASQRDTIKELRAEIERLRERCEAYKGQVKCGADEIERLRADNARFQEANHHYRDAADEARKLRSELAGAREQLVSEQYLVWSNEHRSWWRPNSQGYTRKMPEAGRYSRQQAIDISRGRGWPATGIPDEVPVRECDAVDCFAPSGWHKARYGESAKTDD